MNTKFSHYLSMLTIELLGLTLSSLEKHLCNDCLSVVIKFGVMEEKICMIQNFTK